MEGTALLAGGFVVGLAGSLHCSCVCGGIASSLLLATAPSSSAQRLQLRALASIQAGRALTYVLGGAVVASVGSSFASLMHLAGLQAAARIMAAALLVAVGLSIAGILPRYGLFKAVPAVHERIRRRLPARMTEGLPVVSGMVWGFAPCGMVYNALMMAMVSGSGTDGALFMGGFAIATMPAVSLAAYGSARAVGGASMLSWPRLRTAAGTIVAILGLASAVIPSEALTSLCLPG
jgi:sulfite exporter TauE/SafE